MLLFLGFLYVAIEAIADWRTRGFQFSLRTLLVATTLLAMLLGTVAWMRL